MNFKSVKESKFSSLKPISIMTSTCRYENTTNDKKDAVNYNYRGIYMKRFISAMVILSLLFVLCSCDKYVSSYKAVGLVRGQTSHSCEAKFNSLEGQLVFKLKKTDVGEGNVRYSVHADEGEIHLYYDASGVKEELACVKNGESLENTGGYIEGGFPVYIIIEATEKAKGEISVELDN